MPRALIVALALALLSSGCATDLGTGLSVMEQLEETYPITVGKLVAAHMDPSRRLRVYVSLCHESPNGPAQCGREEPRVLAMVESGERRLLERLAERYLIEGRDKPLYIYGPMCDGLKEMVVVHTLIVSYSNDAGESREIHLTMDSTDVAKPLWPRD